MVQLNYIALRQLSPVNFTPLSSVLQPFIHVHLYNVHCRVCSTLVFLYLILSFLLICYILFFSKLHAIFLSALQAIFLSTLQPYFYHSSNKCSPLVKQMFSPLFKPFFSPLFHPFFSPLHSSNHFSQLYKTFSLRS